MAGTAGRQGPPIGFLHVRAHLGARPAEGLALGTGDGTERVQRDIKATSRAGQIPQEGVAETKAPEQTTEGTSATPSFHPSSFPSFCPSFLPLQPEVQPPRNKLAPDRGPAGTDDVPRALSPSL